MTALDELQRRYEDDPVFHQVVDVLASVILKLELSPYEVRQAAMFAVWRTEMMQPLARPITLTRGALEAVMMGKSPDAAKLRNELLNAFAHLDAIDPNKRGF